MSRKVNPDNIEWWYDHCKLKAEIMWHGHEDYAPFIAKVLSVTQDTAKKKINHTILSHEDTIRIAQALNLDLNEYAGIFLKDVFKDEA